MRKRCSSLYYEPHKPPPQMTRSEKRVSVGKASHPQLRPSNYKPPINAAYLECYDPLVPVNGRPALRGLPLTLDKRAKLANQPNISQQLDWYINTLERNYPELHDLTARLNQAKTFRNTLVYRPLIQLSRREEMSKSAKIRRGVHRSLFYTTGSCFSVLPRIEPQQTTHNSFYDNYYEKWTTPNNIPPSSGCYGRELTSEMQYLSLPTTVEHSEQKINEKLRKMSVRNSEEDKRCCFNSELSLISSLCEDTELPVSLSSASTTPSRFENEFYGYFW